MKKHRKKVIAIFAACMFAMMMMLNVNTTINGTNFSVEGYTALVSGSTGGCSAISCLYPSSCGSMGPCTWREVCDGCSCTFQQVGGYAGSDRCG